MWCADVGERCLEIVWMISCCLASLSNSNSSYIVRVRDVVVAKHDDGFWWIDLFDWFLECWYAWRLLGFCFYATKWINRTSWLQIIDLDQYPKARSTQEVMISYWVDRMIIIFIIMKYASVTAARSTEDCREASAVIIIVLSSQDVV